MGMTVFKVIYVILFIQVTFKSFLSHISAILLKDLKDPRRTFVS